MDSENKATTIRLFSFARPHMSAFHLAWVAFFISFCSTFMAAPLMPIIRDDLDLTATQVGNANSASVAGTVFCRILMGSLCDTLGPRKAYGVLMLLVSFPCFAMTCVTTYAEFVACRCLIGFSLASFVSTQYWTSTMFTPKIVGGANAVTGGWGNLGGGITQSAPLALTARLLLPIPHIVVACSRHARHVHIFPRAPPPAARIAHAPLTRANPFSPPRRTAHPSERGGSVTSRPACCTW